MSVFGKHMGNDLGFRGLVVYNTEKDAYLYMTEKDWRTTTHATKVPAEIANLRETKTALAKVKSAIYIDLDMLTDLEAPSKDAAQGNVQIDTAKSSVVLREKGEFFQISLDDLPELPSGFEGAARVLINRGAVLAAVPKNDIPSGTYCVLLNLASLQDPTT